MLNISPDIALRFRFHNHKYAMTLPLRSKIVEAQAKLEYDPVALDGYWTKQRCINPTGDAFTNMGWLGITHGYVLHS